VRTAAVTTRASVIVAPGRVAEVERSVPEALPGEVVVRIEGCGVCASSLPLWEGRPWFRYPLEPGAPGHEAWGRIQQIGDGVSDLEEGTRVAVLSYHGFAELDRAPAAACVPLPAQLDDFPFPGEAYGCAVNVVRRARIEPGRRVAIVGMGFLGSAIAELCRHLGAEVEPVRRGPAPDGDFDRVIEAAGTQDALDSASALVAEGGLLAIAGYHQDGSRTVDLQSWNWRGIDVVNAHERDAARQAAGVAEAARLAAAGVFDLERLGTHVFGSESLAEAFETARERPPGFTKALVLQ
jgi:threonine dehydrogenase-like Zn-dependent dehydrogenase